MSMNGIAAHNEARRKERVYLKKAYQDLKKVEQDQMFSGNAPNYKPSTYDFEAQRKSDLGLLKGTDPESVDRQRRLSHYKQMEEDYSAKIPNRFSSTNYVSQW